MTIEERLDRSLGLLAVAQQAVRDGSDGDAPAGFSGGLFDLADIIRSELHAVKGALPIEALNLEAAGDRFSGDAARS